MTDIKPSGLRVKSIGFEMFTPVVTKSSIFCDVTPSSLLQKLTDVSKVHVSSGSKRSVKQVANSPLKSPSVTDEHVASIFTLVLTMKMALTSSSETSVEFQRITRRCIPEDRNPRVEACENGITEIFSTVLKNLSMEVAPKGRSVF
jgi:hypothetical protein